MSKRLLRPIAVNGPPGVNKNLKISKVRGIRYYERTKTISRTLIYFYLKSKIELHSLKMNCQLQLGYEQVKNGLKTMKELPGTSNEL